MEVTLCFHYCDNNCSSNNKELESLVAGNESMQSEAKTITVGLKGPVYT